MTTLYDLQAPAKLNLFLHVTGRRPDGYHLLQSVFMLIDWCDTLHISLRPDGQLSREDLGSALPPDDLCLRAARLLQKSTGCPHGAHIAITKSIPSQAGMGGGSSDAATVLLALNQLWNLQLTTAQLSTLGIQLGADVPFFIQGHHAWVEGIGEQITPIDLPPSKVLVIKPTSGLDTASIFSSPTLPRTTKAATIADFAASAAKFGIFEFGKNDLQEVAAQVCPDVGAALTWLTSNNLAGRMTGSGSAVFAAAKPDTAIGDIPVGWQARLCNSLDAHPFLG